MFDLFSWPLIFSKISLCHSIFTHTKNCKVQFIRGHKLNSAKYDFSSSLCWCFWACWSLAPPSQLIQRVLLHLWPRTWSRMSSPIFQRNSITWPPIITRLQAQDHIYRTYFCYLVNSCEDGSRPAIRLPARGSFDSFMALLVVSDGYYRLLVARGLICHSDHNIWGKRWIYSRTNISRAFYFTLLHSPV